MRLCSWVGAWECGCAAGWEPGNGAVQLGGSLGMGLCSWVGAWDGAVQ